MLADFLLNVGCLLSAITIYSAEPILLNCLLILPAIALFVLPAGSKPVKQVARPIQAGKGSGYEELEPLPIRPFITAYRGGMMIITCLAILAVDFRVFPRRFAKVETWGTSLMDMGVGSFVFSAGLVAARPVLQARLSGKQSSLASLLKASPRASLPLLVLGLIRLWSVKGLDYAEHVSEYGVHWNFFFTLALLPPFAALCQPLLAEVHPIVFTIFLGGAYQGLLDNTDLKAYILTSSRTTLLSQNREGIFSFPGYLALFLIGQGVGLDIMPRTPIGGKMAATASERTKYVFYRLGTYSVVWTAMFAVSISYQYGFALQVSRRLANLPYVLWVAAFNCTQLLAFYTVETLAFPNVASSKDKNTERNECDKATSRVLKALNRNGLAIFLLANLLTGLVNKTMNTLSMGHLGSIAVLGAYSLVLTGVALALDLWNISIKF